MAFKNLKISPEARARMDFTRQEMVRIYGLPDRWLGEYLLKLARAAREERPDLKREPFEPVYDPVFVWHLVPNLASRLGVREFQLNEDRDPRVLEADGQALRNLVGVFLNNVSIGRSGAVAKATRPSACELLNHDAANGNPVAIAIDRLVPAPAPGEDRDDHLARYLREISRNRGFEPTATWSPTLQRNPRSRSPSITLIGSTDFTL